MMTGLFPAGTIMRQTQWLKHHASNHAQVKIMSILQKYTRLKNDALIKYDDVSSTPHDSNFQRDTDPTASTDENIPTD